MRGRLVLAALLVVAAACGDSGGTTSVASTAPAATTTTSGPATTVPPVPTEVPATTAPATTVPATTVPPTTATPGEVGWQQVVTSGDGPGPRRNAVLAVDPAAGQAYVHGGREGATSLGDLWRLDLTSGTWEELTGAGPAPAPRFSHTGVWDRARSRLVVFAGQGEGFGDFFSDVWAFDPASGSWTELAPNNAGPADRYGSCAGYDETGDRFLISHGFTDTGRFADTWSFSLADGSWTDVTPDGSAPGARCLHDCSYEPNTGSLVLFGGQNDDVAFLGDTWVLGADGWREVSGPAPSARKFPVTAPLGNVVLLAGGDTADGIVGDLWAFDPAVDAWSSVAGGPGARESAAAAATAVGIYVFGGRGPDGELNDVWFFGTAG